MNKTRPMTIGQFVEELLTDQYYYGTRLPRIPIMIERDIKKKVMIFHERYERKQKNLQSLHLLKPGLEVEVFDKDYDIWRRATIQLVDDFSVHVTYNLDEDLNIEDGLMALDLIEKQAELGLNK